MILNETESKSRKSLGQRFVARKLTFLIVSEGLTYIEGSFLGSIKRNFDLDWTDSTENFEIFKIFIDDWDFLGIDLG